MGEMMRREGSDFANFGTYILINLHLKDYNIFLHFPHKYFFSHLKEEQCEEKKILA